MLKISRIKKPFVKKCRFYQQDFWQRFIDKAAPTNNKVFRQIIKMTILLDVSNDLVYRLLPSIIKNKFKNKNLFFHEFILKKKLNFLEFKNSIFFENSKFLKYKIKSFLRNKKYQKKDFSYVFRENASKMSRRFKTLYARRFAYSKMLKIFYTNINERQFSKICFFSKKVKLHVVKYFLLSLESRVDTFLFRTGLFSSFSEIRQLVTHGNIFVNNFKITKCSYRFNFGEILSIRSFSNIFFYKKRYSRLLNVGFQQIRYPLMLPIPRYIEFNFRLLTGVFLFRPDVFDVPFVFPVKLHSIINFYI